MDKLTKQIIGMFGDEPPKAVFRYQSYIITREEGENPQLQPCHVFAMSDEHGTCGVMKSIVTTRYSDASRVCDILQNRYGMTRYPKGKADPSWLVEAWV